MKDKNGREIQNGDIVECVVSVNRDFHGDWTIFKVVPERGRLILSYLESEKGKLLSEGYITCPVEDRNSSEMLIV